MTALDWSEDAIFTEAHARVVMDRGACDDALLYVGETCGKCARAEKITALECAADLLPPAILDDCAKAEPWTALRFAAHLLTPERLDACVKFYPRTALRYATDRLTHARVKWCEEQLA